MYFVLLFLLCLGQRHNIYSSYKYLITKPFLAVHHLAVRFEDAGTAVVGWWASISSSLAEPAELWFYLKTPFVVRRTYRPYDADVKRARSLLVLACLLLACFWLLLLFDVRRTAAAAAARRLLRTTYHVLSQSSAALLCFLLLDGVYHFLLCRFLRLLCTMCFSWCSAALLCFLLLGGVYHVQTDVFLPLFSAHTHTQKIKGHWTQLLYKKKYTSFE